MLDCDMCKIYIHNLKICMCTVNCIVCARVYVYLYASTCVCFCYVYMFVYVRVSIFVPNPNRINNYWSEMCPIILLYSQRFWKLMIWDFLHNFIFEFYSKGKKWWCIAIVQSQLSSQTHTYTGLLVLSGCTSNSNNCPVVANRVWSCEISSYYWL